MYLNVYQSHTTNFIFIELVVSDCLLNVVLYALYDEKKIKYWIVAIAAPSGVEIPYVDGRKYSITNYSDWITGDIQDLINANKSGFFSVSSNNGKETSGLYEYEKWKIAKEAALDKFVLLDPQQFRDEQQKQQRNQDMTSQSEKQ